MGLAAAQDCPNHDGREPDHCQPAEQITDHRVDRLNSMGWNLNHHYIAAAQALVGHCQRTSIGICVERYTQVGRANQRESIFDRPEWRLLNVRFNDAGNGFIAGSEEDINPLASGLPDDRWEIKVAAHHSRHFPVRRIKDGQLELAHVEGCAAIFFMLEHDLTCGIDDVQPVVHRYGWIWIDRIDWQHQVNTLLRGDFFPAGK